MAIVVVGGSGRNVGKTSLVCGLIAALPELAWTAVKVTSHVHDEREAVWEEKGAGQGTDTGRYLAAGARRAFLLTAPEAFSSGKTELADVLDRFWQNLGRGTNLIFESNRILNYLRPDLCLLVLGARVVPITNHLSRALWPLAMPWWRARMLTRSSEMRLDATSTVDPSFTWSI